MRNSPDDLSYWHVDDSLVQCVDFQGGPSEGAVEGDGHNVDQVVALPLKIWMFLVFEDENDVSCWKRKKKQTKDLFI